MDEFDYKAMTKKALIRLLIQRDGSLRAQHNRLGALKDQYHLLRRQLERINKSIVSILEHPYGTGAMQRTPSKGRTYGKEMKERIKETVTV